MEQAEEKSGLVVVESPWGKYRKLLHHIKKYLKRCEDGPEAFEVLFYDSIPTGICIKNVLKWLEEMEQCRRFSIDSFDRLALVFEDLDDLSGREILLRIREFQLWSRTVKLLVDRISQRKSVYLVRFYCGVVEGSWELHELFQCWRKRLREAPTLTWLHIGDIYRLAAQSKQVINVANMVWVSCQAVNVANTQWVIGADPHLLKTNIAADFLVEEF